MNFQSGGMLGMPLTGDRWGFIVVVVVAVLLSVLVTWFLTRSRLFR